MHVVELVARAILAGELITGRLVRLSAERALGMFENAAGWGIYFDADKADRALKFFGLLRQSKGRWAGRPLSLIHWQIFVVGMVFGWRRLGDGRRLIRLVYLQVARKNGKSAMLSGLGLYMLGYDGESAGEVYSAATTKDQAKIIFEEAKRIALRTQLLRRPLDVRRHYIEHKASSSIFKALAADADTLDGLGPSCNLVDEFHAHKSRDLYDVLDTGQGAREQPLSVIATTAGDSLDGQSPCFEMRGQMIAMLEGKLSDAAPGVPGGLEMFAFIAELDEADDWTDESVWVKANPSLGAIKDLDQMREKLARAKVSPAYRHQFRVKELNQWLQADNRLIDMNAWRACAGVYGPDDLLGEVCHIGVDLSSKQDLTAVVALFPANGVRKRWRALAHFFCPAETIERRTAEDKVPYREWADAGFITETDGARIDYDRVFEHIVDLGRDYDVSDIGVDAWNESGMVSRLIKADFDVVEMRMGFRTLSNPTSELIAMIAGEAPQFEHDANPVLDWMAANTTAKTDENDNIRPRKISQTKRIDGIVALIQALGLALRPEEEDDVIDLEQEEYGEV